jgi:carboxypeptidase Taq
LASFLLVHLLVILLDPEFKALLEKAKEENDLSETDKAIMRNLTHAGKFYFQVPKEIIVEQSKTTSKAFMAWAKAKKENKFSEFAPHLEKIVELAKIIAGHLGYEKNPYDALLDQYEQGLTAEDCEKIFAKLTPALSKIVQKKTKEKKVKKALIFGFTFKKKESFFAPSSRATSCSEVRPK